MVTELTAKQIAARNDALRSKIPFIAKPDVLVITRGIAALPPDEVAEILERVRTFDAFTPDNDPHGEHDFGAFDHRGRKVFFKVDDYQGAEGLRLVLTVMWEDEW